TRDSAIFKAYHITEAGINTNPVFSYTGNQIHGTATSQFAGILDLTFEAYFQGGMQVSPDKTKIAITCINPAVIGAFGPMISSTGRVCGTLLCEFNAATGIVSNAKLIDTLGGYSVC